MSVMSTPSGVQQHGRAADIQCRAVGVPVIGRVEIGRGVADQAEFVNGEFGAGSVVRTRGFPRQVGGDGWPGEPRVGDHACPDDVTEFDEPAVGGRGATAVIRWPSAGALVWSASPTSGEGTSTRNP